MENTNNDTNIVDASKEHTREDDDEEEVFDDVSETTISEE